MEKLLLYNVSHKEHMNLYFRRPMQTFSIYAYLFTFSRYENFCNAQFCTINDVTLHNENLNYASICLYDIPTDKIPFSTYTIWVICQIDKFETA